MSIGSKFCCLWQQMLLFQRVSLFESYQDVWRHTQKLRKHCSHILLHMSYTSRLLRRQLHWQYSSSFTPLWGLVILSANAYFCPVLTAVFMKKVLCPN